MSEPIDEPIFSFERLGQRLRRRIPDILASAIIIAICISSDSGPPDRKAEGLVPLPTDPNSNWTAPAWVPDAHNRGDLSYPLHWKEEDGSWSMERTCGPQELDKAYQELDEAHQGDAVAKEWCVKVMDDPTTPKFDERVYSWEVVVYWGLAAVVAVVFDCLNTQPTTTSYVAGFFITTAVASLSMPIKAAVGRPRPSFYAQQYWALRSKSTVAESLLDDALKSFPSGHSVWAVTAGAFLAGLLRQEVPRWPAGGALLQLSWEAIPIGLGIWTAVTRLEDYRHHPSDILGGVLIGLLAGATGIATRQRDRL